MVTGRRPLCPERLASAVTMTQTTSPFVPLLASSDGCGRQMALNGEPLLERAIALAAEGRRRPAGQPRRSPRR
jgi:arginine/lysine/ornithine decarboxylase